VSSNPVSSNPEAKVDKVEKPETHYENPGDIANDKTLLPQERSKALDNWEQDARQLLTASNEGMAGSTEGVVPAAQNRLDEVIRAKIKTGSEPIQKPSH
jgi:hypothetical protein